MKILINEIIIGTRKRKARKAEEIADSIKTIGLLNPITVDKDYKLIAGLNRLEACKLLGYEFIECNVLNLDGLHSKLAEIDENLIRDDLSVFENAQWLADRKKTYLEIYPETKKGGDRKSENIKVQILDFENKPESFIDSTAKLTEKSRSIIAENIQIATELEHIAEEITELPIANQKTQLLELAKLSKNDKVAAREVVEVLKTNAAKQQYTTINDAKKEVKAVHQITESRRETWEITQLQRKNDCLKGLAVVANQKTDNQLIGWARDNGKLEKCDRTSEWGNPFEIGKDGNRDDVIYKYHVYYFPHKNTLNANLHKLKGKVLLCWCAPLPCHCDAIASMVNSLA